MQQRLLDAPRTAVEDPPPPAPFVVRDPSGTTSCGRELLGEALPASPRRRRLFHPERGWFRRIERELAHLLASRVYPRVPGISRPYDRQLERTLILSETEIELPGLGVSFDGARLLLITDVHAGPFLSREVLRRTFERLAAVEPDLILLGGDLTTSCLEDFLRFRDSFRALRAPLGVFSVLGNHDHYTEDPLRLRTEIEAEGIRVLHNAWTAVEREGSRLTLAGVDDLLMGRPDLDRALCGAPAPVILLSHNPDLLFDAQRRGVALMLSGHTHAGQIRVPGLPVIVRQSRYRLDAGRYRAGATELVVSRGLGVVGLPWRIACPPEAVLVRIRRTPTAASPPRSSFPSPTAAPRRGRSALP